LGAAGPFLAGMECVYHSFPHQAQRLPFLEIRFHGHSDDHSFGHQRQTK
jgi:hypothetical protein